LPENCHSLLTVSCFSYLP